jgi:tRNA (guanine37-N1)-methyltransferase
MRFHVLTIFPGMFDGPLSGSLIQRARDNGLVEVHLYDVRDHALDRHRRVDDYAFGGGPGMVMKPEPIFEAVDHVRQSASLVESTPIILMTPQGRRLDQPLVEELAAHADLVLICGRYEGVDERVRQHLATDEISIGDYVLSGGELAAMVVVDAVARLVPGVVGCAESPANDTFTSGLIQHPLYTRPAEYRGMTVPQVLLSGHHAEIARWQRLQALRRTLERRPELLDRVETGELSEDDLRFLDEKRDETRDG